MQVDITGKQMDITPALRDYVNTKVNKAEKYLHRDYGVQVILDVNKLIHTCEVIVNVKGGRITAKEHGEEMYASIDLAMDKVEQQLRKYKEKLSHHKGGQSMAEVALQTES
ncbi:MAG: ribosome-associated translation inhibitor RaiA [Nitrospirae bacterium]|nr:ribosome-associated translation inhibitor RaiA [Nitrospirota bacterium]